MTTNNEQWAANWGRLVRNPNTGDSTGSHLDHRVFDGRQQLLVHIRGQRVIHEDVGALAAGPKCPRPSGQPGHPSRSSV